MAELLATRAAYGDALAEFGADPRVIVLEADLGECTNSLVFGRKYPDRFFEIGIAEANMVGIAAGFAACGKIAVANTFAVFAAGRAYDQIRSSCAYPGLNVKIVGTNAGLTAGKDGATHQMLEDLALMRAHPGMTVLSPCDANETREAVRAMLACPGPVYMRTGRLPVENVTAQLPGYRFELGKGCVLRDGRDVTLAATGLMVQMALKAADLLAERGLDARVLDMHTIKPFDSELLLKAARETGAVVTAEEHSVIGGLGGAAAEALGKECPVPLERVGTEDTFGRSGDAEGLLTAYGLTPGKIAEAALRAAARRRPE